MFVFFRFVHWTIEACFWRLLPGCDGILILKGSAVTFEVEGVYRNSKTHTESWYAILVRTSY